jgi:hypothetical protein
LRQARNEKGAAARLMPNPVERRTAPAGQRDTIRASTPLHW